MNDDPTALGSVIDPWHESFYEALRESDPAALEPLLAGDVILIPANEHTLSGRNAVCFLVNTAEDSQLDPITVVINWLATLKK